MQAIVQTEMTKAFSLPGPGRATRDGVPQGERLAWPPDGPPPGHAPRRGGALRGARRPADAWPRAGLPDEPPSDVPALRYGPPDARRLAGPRCARRDGLRWAVPRYARRGALRWAWPHCARRGALRWAWPHCARRG